MASYALAIMISGLVSLTMTPLVRSFALNKGATVKPGERSVHTKPIPHMGGVAIYLGFTVGLLATVREVSPETLGLLVGGALTVLLGVSDDFFVLSPKAKLIGQIITSLVLVASGVRIEFLSNPYGGMILLGRFAVPLTVFWIVSLMNVVNFIDGLDGLAAGIVAIASLTMLFVARQIGQFAVATIAGAVAGACIGFLPYNFNPATIFMGDAGALFLGYALAMISAEGTLKSATAIALVPVLALGLPIFDTAFAIIRRICNGRSPAAADRSHIHHRLLAMGLNQRQAVVLLYMASGLLGLTSILFLELGFRNAMPIIFLVLGGMVAAAKTLGVLDLREPEASERTNADSTVAR